MFVVSNYMWEHRHDRTHLVSDCYCSGSINTTVFKNSEKVNESSLSASLLLSVALFLFFVCECFFGFALAGTELVPGALLVQCLIACLLVAYLMERF